MHRLQLRQNSGTGIDIVTSVNQLRRESTGRPALCCAPLSSGHGNAEVISGARLLVLTGRCPMSNDPFMDFKRKQRESWTTITPAATFTTPVASTAGVT